MEALGLFGNAIGAIVNGWMQNAQMDSNEQINRNNIKLANYQMKFQNWQNNKSRAWLDKQAQIERLYNTPSAQMQRFKDAGLNPFLSGGASADPGLAKMPSSPSPQSAPNMPQLRPNDYMTFANALSGHINSGLTWLLQKQQVDANSASQSAQMMKDLMEAVNSALKDGNDELADKLLGIGLPQIQGINFDKSLIHATAKANLWIQNFTAGIKDTQDRLAAKYGAEKAQREIFNLDQWAAQSQTNVGLMNALSKVYDSNVRMNDVAVKKIGAEIGELVSREYKNYAESGYVGAKKLTEDEFRPLLLGNLAIQFLNGYIGHEENLADFQENEYVRSYKKSTAGKSAKAAAYGTNSVLSTVDRVLETANKGIPLKNALMPSTPVLPATPWGSYSGSRNY